MRQASDGVQKQGGRTRLSLKVLSFVTSFPSPSAATRCERASSSTAFRHAIHAFRQEVGICEMLRA